MKRLFFYIILITAVCLIPLIGFTQDKPRNMMPPDKIQQPCQGYQTKNFYDKYSKGHLEQFDCQEEMRTNNRVFIFDQTYQPWVYNTSPAHRLYYNYGWGRGR
jgi:hypothetical protein